MNRTPMNPFINEEEGPYNDIFDKIETIKKLIKIQNASLSLWLAHAESAPYVDEALLKKYKEELESRDAILKYFRENNSKMLCRNDAIRITALQNYNRFLNKTGIMWIDLDDPEITYLSFHEEKNN